MKIKSQSGEREHSGWQSCWPRSRGGTRLLESERRPKNLAFCSSMLSTPIYRIPPKKPKKRSLKNPQTKNIPQTRPPPNTSMRSKASVNKRSTAHFSFGAAHPPIPGANEIRLQRSLSKTVEQERSGFR